MSTQKLLLVTLALTTAVACSEQGLGQYTGPEELPDPDIDVQPALVDFGMLTNGEEGRGIATVQNVGGADLHITDIRVAGDGFEYLGETEMTLAPSESAELDLAFTALAADEQHGILTVFSNDPDESVVEVDLLGEGSVPSLLIDPSPYDFGTVGVGCSRSQDFTFTNVGTAPLRITGSEFSQGGGMMFYSDYNAWPMNLQPGESTEVRLDFVPDEVDDVTGKITVHSNDPRGDVATNQTATSSLGGHGEDTYAIPEDPEVDIIFAVDQSCSMDDDVARIAANFSDFISQIGNVTNDWRIGVATKDDGCFNNGILRSSTSNYVSKFQDAVAGNGGLWTEALLTVGYHALQNSGGTDCNAGFLRSDALLHFILVSDEPEQSLQNWSWYVNQYETYKADPSLIRVSAVVGDVPNGCSTADAGTGYYEATQATGGVFLSICDTNWSQHVGDLATASLTGLYDFELSKTPDPATIRVWVNGNEWTTGWTYNSVLNEVSFGQTDLPGGTLKVSYTIIADCD